MLLRNDTNKSKVPTSPHEIVYLEIMILILHITLLITVNYKQDRQCTYNVTLRLVHETTIAVGMQ